MAFLMGALSNRHFLSERVNMALMAVTPPLQRVVGVCGRECIKSGEVLSPSPPLPMLVHLYIRMWAFIRTFIDITCSLCTCMVGVPCGHTVFSFQ